MTAEEFRAEAHKMVDWMADYLQNVEKYPVKSQVQPGEVFAKIDNHPPEASHTMADIFGDFQEQILPGMTHWQSPNFFAYFPANGSYPSLLAEMLTASMGAQCMIWDTSPAAAELEEKMMHWLREITGLPENWEGAIQSTASEATLCAILSARERATDFSVNQNGLQGEACFRVYCSSQTHSSVEKGAKIAGLGKRNTIKISVDEDFAMRPDALLDAIQQDLAGGMRPLCVVATLGTTSSTAIDPLREIGKICKEYGIWLHVDAAYGGSALVLPEYRYMLEGVELADSFVFNPHKWLFVHFDCSAYFVKDPASLVQTFEILPEYLKTEVGHRVNNYRDWGIPLGRRFRALKLWFSLRSFGLKEIQYRIRLHNALGKQLAEWVKGHDSFELMAPVPMNLVCFRFHPSGLDDEIVLEKLNTQLVSALNRSGKMYLTHTKLNGRYTIRLCIGQTEVQHRHVEKAWERIQQTAQNILINDEKD